MPTATPLTNLQQELLKLFAQRVSEEDLVNIRELLIQYFANQQPLGVETELPISPDIQALQGSVQLPDASSPNYLTNKYFQ